MRARTEDLLKILDGEPVDAVWRTRLCADPDNLRELERLEQLRARLKGLPNLDPPTGAWDRISAAVGAGGSSRPRRTAELALGALAASVAAAALLLGIHVARQSAVEDPVSNVRPALAESDPAGTERLPTAPGNARPNAAGPGSAKPYAVAGSAGSAKPDSVAGSAGSAKPLGADSDGGGSMLAAGAAGAGAASSTEADEDAGPRSHLPLAEESARLEQLLSRLVREPHRRVMNAATARTIADLEDHLVVLDEQLTFAVARGANERQRQALWQERVDVMNALLHVRYAQSSVVVEATPIAVEAAQ